MEDENSSQPMRAQTPLQGEGADADDPASCAKAPPLPTPEERMRRQAQAVLTDIVPINVTGEHSRLSNSKPHPPYGRGQWEDVWVCLW